MEPALAQYAGHVAGGMSRSDLKNLGELLDNGTSGLLVVAATDVEAKVNAAITRAKRKRFSCTQKQKAANSFDRCFAVI